VKIKIKRILGLSLCAAFLIHGSVFAAENDTTKTSLGTVDVVSSSDTESTGSYTIDSMNSATRLNLSPKHTPQSISVITHEQIKDRGLESIADVVNSVTGLSVNRSDSERQSFAARGFNINNYQIDGITTSWSAGYSTGESQQDLTIYDRVEIVRGANGLISGAGDPSAAINLIKKRANSKEVTGNVSIEGGSWNKYKGNIDISTPITEDGSVRARFAASLEDKESFEDFYEKEKKVFYGIVEADLTDNTKLSLGASYQDNNPKGSMWGGLPSKFSDGTKTNWDSSKTTAPKWSYWASENKNYFIELEHYFKNDIKIYSGYSKTENNADLKLSYAYGSLDRNTGLGLSGSGYLGDFEREQDNIDIYASVPFELGGQNHEILAGVMYSKQNSEAYSASASVGSLGNFFEWDGNIAEPNFGEKQLRLDLETKQIGAYLAGRFSLGDSVKLITGARITNYEKEEAVADLSYEHDNIFTPYIGLVYDITDDYSIYASYTDIFKPQDERDSSGDFLDPIEGKSYETGIKAEFFDDKLDASFSVFRIEQDKLAQTDPTGVFVPGTTDVASIAAEGTTSRGFEIELNGEITENWNVSAGYAHFIARDADKNDVNPNQARKTFKLFTKYELDKLSLGAGLNWQTATENRGVYQEAYTIVDAMAKYQFSKNLSAQLNIDNVFDEEYYSNVGFYSQVAIGAPRSAMISLKYTF